MRLNFNRARSLLLLSSPAALARVVASTANTPQGGSALFSAAVQSSSKPFTSWSSLALLRGGGGGNQRDYCSSRSVSSSSSSSVPSYEVRAHPAPGTPFHYAFPVHDLELAKEFYSSVLGCEEGRSSEKWQDYSLHGHQIVCHWVGKDYRCIDYYNPVAGDEVPVPHVGLALTMEQFHVLAKRVEEAGIKFIIKPHLRFKDMPGEQYTMFFKDPSGNNLEFKAMTKPENLFAKYNVVDDSDKK